MAYRADLTIHSPDGDVVAIVAIINVPQTDRAVAIATRENLVNDYSLPDAPYFLLVTQDWAFLWSRSSHMDPKAPPAVEIPMAPIVKSFLPNIDEDSRLHPTTLELVIFRWLLGLTTGIDVPNGSLPAASATDGFLDAIRGGRVDMEALV